LDPPSHCFKPAEEQIFWQVEIQLPLEQVLPEAQTQVPPQPSEPHVFAGQLTAQATQTPLLLQDCPLVQFPQEPPQPSDPQALPEQLGVQPATQAPLLLQDCPEAQVPQEPPHPSDPQVFPEQLGVQVFPEHAPAEQVWPLAQAVTLDQAVHPLLATAQVW